MAGSALATYGMARGYLEFWLVWIGVDAVGVPLLLNAGYYPSAILDGIYGAFVVWGFGTWLRIPGSPDCDLQNLNRIVRNFAVLIALVLGALYFAF